MREVPESVSEKRIQVRRLEVARLEVAPGHGLAPAAPEVGPHALGAVGAAAGLERGAHAHPERPLGVGARAPPPGRGRCCARWRGPAGRRRGSTPIPIALAALPARCFSTFSKEAGPGAFRTSNTAAASASLTSAIRALSAGSSGRSAAHLAPLGLLRVPLDVPQRRLPSARLEAAARRRPRGVAPVGGAALAVGAVHPRRPVGHLPGDEPRRCARYQPPVEVVWVGEQRQRGAGPPDGQAAPVELPQYPLALLPSVHPRLLPGPSGPTFCPRSPRRQKCGSATTFVHEARDMWQCHAFRAPRTRPVCAPYAHVTRGIKKSPRRRRAGTLGACS